MLPNKYLVFVVFIPPEKQTDQTDPPPPLIVDIDDVELDDEVEDDPDEVEEVPDDSVDESINVINFLFLSSMLSEFKDFLRKILDNLLLGLINSGMHNSAFP